MRIKQTILSVFLLLCIGTVTAQNETPTPQPGVMIQPGSYQGEIDADSFRSRYRFQVALGDRVTLRMEGTSGDLDPFLFVFDPDEQLIASNDDADDRSRSAGLSFEAAREGLYTVEATRFDQEQGTTSGEFRLVLTVEMAVPVEMNPLNIPPAFGVEFQEIVYETSYPDGLDFSVEKRYYALGGQQGDLVRVSAQITEGDLQLNLSILNSDFVVISLPTSTPANEWAVYATLPSTGWYLIEANRIGGSGRYDLRANRLAGTIIEPGNTINGAFTPETPTLSYVFQATIGDRVFVDLRLTDASENTAAEIRILDLNLTELAFRKGSESLARTRTAITRSGLYILQAQNTGTQSTTGFELSLLRVPVDISKLNQINAAYNKRYSGLIENGKPIDYYAFSGKAGELVTIEMRPTGTVEATLDPYLILADAALNELVFNDNSGAALTARITRYRLPADGDYIILATRAGLAGGSTIGAYDLKITAGEIDLIQGAITATLRWESEADLNLFIREPSGRIVSWSSPSLPSGAALQIESNTNCITPTDQPIEHIHYPDSAPEIGDYAIWVWYQTSCMNSGETPFTLTVTANNETVVQITPEKPTILQPGQRFEAVIRLTETETFVANPGSVTRPSPQQTSSQGGDTLLLYDQSITGTLNNEVYALYYQFTGKAGDEISIKAERVTGNLDPVLILRGTDDRNLAVNDDLPGSTDSFLTYILPADGQYVIAVSRFGLRDGRTSGDFRLTLKRTAELIDQP